MEFIVNRSKWANGSNSLYRPINKSLLKLDGFIFYSSCEDKENWVALAKKVNDDPLIDNKEREEKLIEIFNNEGYKLTFTGSF